MFETSWIFGKEKNTMDPDLSAPGMCSKEYSVYNWLFLIFSQKLGMAVGGDPVLTLTALCIT